MKLLSRLRDKAHRTECENCGIVEQRDTLGQTLQERNLELAAERAASQELRIKVQVLTLQIEAAGDVRMENQREIRQLKTAIHRAEKFSQDLLERIDSLNEQYKRVVDENETLRHDAEAYAAICASQVMCSKSNRRQHPGHHKYKAG